MKLRKISEIEKNHVKKSYDAAMFLQLNNTCNLNCEYCISDSRIKIQKRFDIVKIENFIKNLDRKFLFIYEGDGEPTLQPQILEISRIITKHGHFIAITSNMTSDAVAKIAEEINPKQIDYILASAHTSELKKNGLLDKYFRNCLLFQNKGVSVVCMEIGHPALIPEIPRLKKMFDDQGLKLQFDHFRGEYDGKTYPYAYTKEELDAFGLTNVKEKFNVFCKFCNAGYNLFAAELVSGNGDIYSCRTVKKKMGNVWAGTFYPDSEPKVCLKRTCTNPYTMCNFHLYQIMLDKLNPSKKKYGFKELKRIKGTVKEINRRTRAKSKTAMNKMKGVIGRGMIRVSPIMYRSIKKLEKKIKKI